MMVATMEVRAKVIALMKSYVGREIEVAGHELIGQDVGITRGDSVEFQDEIEEMFSVDLRPLVQAHAVTPRPGWFDRLLGQNRRAYSDFTVDELVNFISKSAT
jgi:hypothetical protein